MFGVAIHYKGKSKCKKLHPQHIDMQHTRPFIKRVHLCDCCRDNSDHLVLHIMVADGGTPGQARQQE